MLGTMLKHDTRELIVQWRERASALEKPARHLVWCALRVVYPVVLISVPIFMALFGAPTAGLISLFAAGALLVYGFSQTKGRRKIESVAALFFCFGAGIGMPKALYDFTTTPCLGAASSSALGDVRSLHDPRLSTDERAWVQRTMARLTPVWPQAGLPELDVLTIANIVVQARAVIEEIAWRGTEPLTRLGLLEAKHAYAAMNFDRRSVCALYGDADRAYGLHLINDSSQKISADTERALALILPALQETYVPATTTASGPAPSAPAGITVASKDAPERR